MTTKGRLIISGPANPSFNMACDEALALSAKQPVLRFYQWEPSSLSIGHFQTIDEISPFLEKLGSPPVVKRITGGGAIYHHEELTYSITAPHGVLPLPEKTEESYRFLHSPFITVFKKIGINAKDNDPVSPDRNTICFDSITRYDVVVSGRKLLGSAQRRTKDFFLQHGSIPLTPNPFSGHATSIFEETGKTYTPEELIPLFTTEISSALDIELAKSDLTAAEAEKTAILELKYNKNIS